MAGSSWDELPVANEVGAGTALIVTPDGKLRRATQAAMNAMGLQVVDELRASVGHMIQRVQLTATAQQEQITGMAGSIAGVMSNAQGRIDANFAEFLDFKQVQADQNEAFAESIQTLQAGLGGGNGVRTYMQGTAPNLTTHPDLAIGDLWFDTANGYSMHRWNGTSWDQTDNVALAANTAAIATEASVRASQISGIQARWGVTVDVNGNISGIQLLSGSGGSAFNVRADSFNVTLPGYASAPVFSVGTVNGSPAVTIRGQLIQDGSVGYSQLASNSVDGSKITVGAITSNNIQNNAVTTAHLIPNAVNVPIGYTNQTGVYGTGARQLIAVGGVNFTQSAFVQMLFVANQLYFSGPTPVTFEMELSSSGPVAGTVGDSSTIMASVAMGAVRNLSPGSHTLYVYWTAPSSVLCGNILMMMFASMR